MSWAPAKAGAGFDSRRLSETPSAFLRDPLSGEVSLEFLRLINESDPLPASFSPDLQPNAPRVTRQT